MRQSLVAILLLCWVGQAAPGQQFPYTGTINADDVYIRSGPGTHYYPTTRMNQGDTVEVYRHDQEGWFAIRPPRGSFTWVLARHVQPTGGRFGKVTGDHLAARVGSLFSDIRDVIQVRLDRDEVVEILDRKDELGGADAGTWYKISPPAGEFRWVRGESVDGPYSHSHAIGTASSSAPPAAPRAAADSGPAPPEKRPASGTAAPVTDVIRASDNWTSAAGSTGSATTYISPRLPELAGVRPSGDASEDLTAEQLQAELDDINLDLSIMLAEEPTVWQLDELRTRAEPLLDQAASSVERGKVRMLLNTIEQSADIKRRYEEVTRQDAVAQRPDHQPVAPGERRVDPTPTLGDRSPELDASRFDGTGRLARVVSAKLGSPRYALVDAQGQVSSYVTPAPGLNLQYYVGRQVGVTGIRGHFAEQNAQHITAKHIAPLDGKLF